MTLLSTNEIKRGLDKEFVPLEPMLTGFRLIAGGLSDDSLDKFEHDIGVSLPASFREFIKEYDFGKLTIGPVAFSNSGDYVSELTNLNTKVAWWRSGSRPANLLMIANSDPFAILLNLDSGEVLAMDAERGWQSASAIARSFDLFVKGVGTTMLGRRQAADLAALGCNVAFDVGSSEQTYWIQLAK